MNISSSYLNTSLSYELREHPSSCQCPGCCKTSESLESKSDTSTQQHVESSKDEIKLSIREQEQLMRLQLRDNEVRTHEAAHISAGGSAVSGSASFNYQKGPDGRLYATGGEVAINPVSGNTPEEKILHARQVQAGALAPASPSAQDMKAASSAALVEAQARLELALEKRDINKEQAINTYHNNQDGLNQKHSLLSLQA